MKTELIEKFEIPHDIAAEMAGIYNEYISNGDASLADCQQSLLMSMQMLDLGQIDEAVNRAGGNDAYYVAREIVRLPFDSEFMVSKYNTMPEVLRQRLGVAEFRR